MSQYQQIFERYETKYLLSAAQYRILSQELECFTQPDHFAKSTVCNIYYDTPDRRMIRTSLEKPAYKEKLRLRSYGTPGDADEVFVELKKKYRGVVYKRRESMDLLQAEFYLKGLARPQSPSQITREIDWVMKSYPGIAPSMSICYAREALCGLEDSELRITFDSRILYRETNLSLAQGSWGTSLLGPGQRLMELKLPGCMPLWLSHLLDELMLSPVSFSKYGNAYLQTLTTRKEAAACA